MLALEGGVAADEAITAAGAITADEGVAAELSREFEAVEDEALPSCKAPHVGSVREVGP